MPPSSFAPESLHSASVCLEQKQSRAGQTLRCPDGPLSPSPYDTADRLAPGHGTLGQDTQKPRGTCNMHESQDDTLEGGLAERHPIRGPSGGALGLLGWPSFFPFKRKKKAKKSHKRLLLIFIVFISLYRSLILFFICVHYFGLPLYPNHPPSITSVFQLPRWDGALPMSADHQNSCGVLHGRSLMEVG